MTKNNNSLKKNFIMNAILTMSSFIFPLITFPYVSRILLPEGTGKVSFATSVISYFAMFAQLGIPTYGIRACAKVRDNKTLLSQTVHELFIINIIMSVFAYIIFFVALLTIPRLQQDKTLFVIVSSTIILNTIGVEWLYKALEQYTYITLRSLIFKFIGLIAVFFLVHQKSDYIIYGGITIFAASASNILNFIKVHNLIDFKYLKLYDFRKHFKAIAIFFAMSCATTIYTHLDTVMLGFMKTDEDVGYYNAAVKIKMILVSIVTSLGAVLLPRASYYIENGLKEDFLRMSKKAMNFVILTATPLTVFFLLFAEEGILFLSGPAYRGSIIPMQIIMPTLLFIGMTNIIGIQMLIPLGKENYVLYSEVAGAIVNLILNMVLIPQWAAAGAALGTLVAEIVVWGVQMFFLKEIFPDLYKHTNFFSIVGAILLSGFLAFFIKRADLNNFFTLAISAVIFGISYIGFLIFIKEPLVLEVKEQILKKLK